ncbi:probable LRR receptor-like serine/threonine-protein kinase At1g56130 [Macadamia integrifolia]|uniref:probable LRR receptor-like serine/threonine-protein kinase At1g56130 n=1 Tax=Macadamia integrifolia TaxID=60698 RepID=UPI001C52D1B6|nr:probable LRR receptor-like serine/threonine-protein kinase At1g56130 [Macadamia integrifolia]
MEEQRKKKSMLKPRCTKCFSVFAHALWTIYFLSQLLISEAQTANATTDPSEVRALNSIFQKWGIKATANWNISGEPCSGYAIDTTDLDNNGAFNPGIKCDCSYNNGSTCHMTHLKVYALEVVGTIVDELMNLTYLNNLKEAYCKPEKSHEEDLDEFESQLQGLGSQQLAGAMAVAAAEFQKLWLEMGL